MKTGILIAVLLTINSISYGQDVNYQYFDKNWNTSSKKSAFFIREISIINDTLYQITETNKFGRVLMTGSFRSLNPLVENGPFMFFTKTCGFDTIKGNYRNGDMIGNWSYKNANNEPIIINYDFTLKECLNYEGNQFDQNNYYVIVEKFPHLMEVISIHSESLLLKLSSSRLWHAIGNFQGQYLLYSQ